MATPPAKPRSFLAQTLAYLVNGTPTLANVTSTTLMLLFCGATLGSLAPELAAGHLGPALTAFMTSMGVNLFSGVLDRLRSRKETGQAITQADIDEILAELRKAHLEEQLNNEDFQLEMRNQFARLDVMTDLIQLVPGQTAALVVQAMDTRIELFTVNVITAVSDAAAQSAQRDAAISDKLDTILKEVTEAQGSRLKPSKGKPPARHIFISYAHADGEDFARKLHDSLESDGIAAWLDRYDIPPGAEWDETIKQAIEDCKLFVFVVTPSSIISQVCKNEYTYALSTKQTIVPALWLSDQVPFQLNHVQNIDFRGDFSRAISKLRLWFAQPDTPVIPAAEVKQAEDRAVTVVQTQQNSRQGWQVRSKLINGLPQDVTGRFQDRTKQQADIVNLLIAEKAPLVSIYGRAGVGKTALASKVLDDLQKSSDCPDGIVCLRETRREATDTGISVERIFNDFGKLLSGNAKTNADNAWRDPQMPMGQKVSILLDELREGRYMLLLDNMETFRDPDTFALTDADLGTFFEVLLRKPHTLQVIVTSREPITFDHDLKTRERIVPLDEGLPVDDAVALLRAFDPNGKAGLRDAPAEKLRLIWKRTEGYPRALEAVAGLLLEDELRTLDELLTDGTLFASEVTPVIVQQAIARLNSESLRVMEALALFGRPTGQPALEFLLAPYMETARLREILLRLVRSRFAGYNTANLTYVLHPIDQEYCYNRIPVELLGQQAKGI